MVEEHLIKLESLKFYSDILLEHYLKYEKEINETETELFFLLLKSSHGGYTNDYDVITEDGK